MGVATVNKWPGNNQNIEPYIKSSAILWVCLLRLYYDFSTYIGWFKCFDG